MISRASILFFVGLLLIACDKDKENPTIDQPTSSSKYPTLSGKDPLIVAHRGASGYLPEHTIEAYTKAIELGADFIEPDLVMTKDGYLVVRHEPMLSGTTNVASIAAFANKKTTKNVDGVNVNDWFVCDFYFS